MRSLLIAAAPLALAGADTPLVVDAGPIAATVAGTSARIELRPDAPSMPVFNPGFALKAGFRAGRFGTRAGIGPVRIPGRSAVIRIDLAAASSNAASPGSRHRSAMPPTA